MLMDNEPINQPRAPKDENEAPTTDQPAPDQSVSDYIGDIKLLQQQKRRKKITTIAIVVTLVLAAGVGAYITLSRDSDANQTEAPQASQAESQPQLQTISGETTEHQSQQFFLSFKHPIDWEIVDERGSGQLTATSPALDIPLDGQATSGKVLFTIRKSSQDLDEFDAGNALAVIDSEKITYENPSQAQRGETHLSFLSYADSASSSLIDGIYITGDFGYQKGQAIPLVDIKKIDSVYSVTFAACDGICETPLAIPPSAWENPEFWRAY